MFKHPVVKIIWMDAEVESGWKSPEEVEKMTAATCCTIGFLVKKPTKARPVYVVASTVGIDDGDDGDTTAHTKIPKSWVKSVEEFDG